MADEKNPAAVSLGSLGGSKGGVARAAKLTPAERKLIAQGAAQARWATRNLGVFTKSLVAQMPDMTALSKSLAAQMPDMTALNKSLAAQMPDMTALNKSLAAQMPDMTALNKSLAAQMPDMTALNKSLAAQMPDMTALNKSLAAQMPDMTALNKSLAAQMPESTRTWMMNNRDLVTVGAAVANQITAQDTTAGGEFRKTTASSRATKQGRSHRSSQTEQEPLTPEQTAAFAWLCVLMILYCTALAPESQLGDDLRVISLGTIGSLIVWGLAQYHQKP